MQTLLSRMQSNLSGRHLHFATSDELLALICAKDAKNILITLHSHPFQLYHSRQDLIDAVPTIDWNLSQNLFVKDYGVFIVENDETTANKSAINLLEGIKNFIDIHISLPCGECEGKSDPLVIDNIVSEISSLYRKNFFHLIIDSPRGQFFTILPNLLSLISNINIPLDNKYIIPPALIIDKSLSECLDQYSSLNQLPPRYVIVQGIGIIILGDNEPHARQIGKAIKRAITIILTAEQLGGMV